MTQTTTTSQASFPAQSTTETSNLQTLQRDGVTLAYTQAGSGTPPLLFVHGWAGDHTPSHLSVIISARPIAPLRSI